MVDRDLLLADCKSLVSRLEDDLRERLKEFPELDAPWREEYAAAREVGRTGAGYGAWLDEGLTQVAASWVLGCVFVRFLEDNDLVDEVRLSGPGERRSLAMDRHLLYFRAHPAQTDRDYLLWVFEEVAALPGAAEVFDRRHNPLWRLGPSGDAARWILDLWQRREGSTGELVHDFTDAEWDTRFLGDLYQDLSEAARKRYALLQTPDFVEAFLLDRTLEPAIEEFGLKETRLLDPTCGSGHFLLGAFSRLVDRWIGVEAGGNLAVAVQRALDAVVGVDVNPFAVAIARFRLTVAALKACNVKKLIEAPGFRMQLACGDSLLHGPRFGATRGTQINLDPTDDPLRFVYETEDRETLREILGRRYSAVVGNPPYITVKDKALNQAYRAKYGSCSGSYSLSVPFFERFFELALPGDNGLHAGFVGQITSNSFMKREFGKKLVTEFIPLLDLTHVIDTSGAYIPGHGTPTVILVGRNRYPVKTAVRSVLGIRGEPDTPEDPAYGKVWVSILEGIDQSDYENDFVSVGDKSRKLYSKHPWTLTGGGAVELKVKIEKAAVGRLSDSCTEIGFGAVTREDEAYLLGTKVVARHGVEPSFVKPLVEGDKIRDWSINEPIGALWPYSEEELQPSAPVAVEKLLWPNRCRLRDRVAYGKTQLERGLEWYEYSMFFANRYRRPMSLSFAFVATHNHFVLDRGGKVFNRTAPVIKLPADATEDDHLALLGLLNSSVGCFWMQQVCHNKGGPGGGSSKDEKWHDFYEHDGSKLRSFPIPNRSRDLLPITRVLDVLADELVRIRPDPSALAEFSVSLLNTMKERRSSIIGEMIALQEELDWHAYHVFGLVPSGDDVLCGEEDIPHIRVGERAFEMVLARRVKDQSLQTRWFDKLGATKLTEPPTHWPEAYRKTVFRRIQLIETSRDIALMESMNCKRRWEVEPWDDIQDQALRDWLLDRLESDALWSVAPTLRSITWITDRLTEQPGVPEVLDLYAGTDHDPLRVTESLLTAAAVPYLAAWRYKPTGLRKRQAWESVWAKQRQEDQGEDVGDIPVPPKYGSTDFQSATVWRLRGKLDVPKERFISYPGTERENDPAPVYGWAGWNHLQQAQALAAFYLEMKEDQGWTVDRLLPLLGGLLELQPWILQWHDSDQDQSDLGAYFATFVDEEARDLGATVEAVKAWSPPKKTRRRRTKA